MGWISAGAAVASAYLGSRNRGSSSSGGPKWLRSASRRLVDAGERYSNRPYVRYLGPRVAGMSEAEREYGRSAIESAPGLRGYAGRAATSWADTDQSKYIDPYAEAAIQPSLRRRAEAGGAERERLKSAAVSRGAFGGARGTLLETANLRDTEQGLDDLYYGGMSDAYRFGANQFGVDQDRLLRAGQANDEALARYGTLDRGLEQGRQDVDYSNFLEERDWGPSQMQYLIQAIQAARAQQVNTYSGSRTAGAIGGALAGYQLARGFQNNTDNTGTTTNADTTK